MKTIERTNTKGLVKYRNLLGRMYKDFDVLPIGNIPKKYLDERIHQMVVIELVKEDCFVVISKMDEGYSVFIDIRDEHTHLYYNGKQDVPYYELRHLLEQIDFDYFIRRITGKVRVENFNDDTLTFDDELPF